MLKPTFTFLAHQLLSTVGVMLGCGIATTETVSLLNRFLAPSHALHPPAFLTETPGFPLQIACALALGYSLARRRRFKGMLWVWIFPSLVFSLAALQIDASHRALTSYFFGNGCLVAKGCFTQTAVTLPVLSSTAYALGALLASCKFERIGTVQPGRGILLDESDITAGSRATLKLKLPAHGLRKWPDGAL